MTQNMSGHNPPPAPPPAVCALCAMWSRLPHGARYSTPVSVPEAEMCLVVGYWVRARHPADLAVRLCRQHSEVLETLDQIEERRPTMAQAPAIIVMGGLAQPGLAASILAGPNARPPVLHVAAVPSIASGECGELVTDTLRCARKAGHKGSHSTVPDVEAPEPRLVGGVVLGAPEPGVVFPPIVSAPTRAAMGQLVGESAAGTPVVVEIQTPEGVVKVEAEQASQEAYKCPLCGGMSEPGKLHRCEG